MGKKQASGHVQVYVGKKGDKEIWRYEHELVIEKKMGRKLRSGEVVHHKDGNPSNNTPSNLEVVSKGRHNTIDPELHNGGRKKGS